MSIEAVLAVVASAAVAFGVLLLKDRLTFGSTIARELGQLTTAIDNAVKRLDKFENSVDTLSALVAPLAAADAALRDLLQHHYATRDDVRAALRKERHGMRNWFHVLILELQAKGVAVTVPKELLASWGDEFSNLRSTDPRP